MIHFQVLIRHRRLDLSEGIGEILHRDGTDLLGRDCLDSRGIQATNGSDGRIATQVRHVGAGIALGLGQQELLVAVI